MNKIWNAILYGNSCDVEYQLSPHFLNTGFIYYGFAICFRIKMLPILDLFLRKLCYTSILGITLDIFVLLWNLIMVYLYNLNNGKMILFFHSIEIQPWFIIFLNIMVTYCKKDFPRFLMISSHIPSSLEAFPFLSFVTCFDIDIVVTHILC